MPAFRRNGNKWISNQCKIAQVMSYSLFVIVAAYFLDLAIGDPQWAWHPVRIIGRLIAWLEKRLNTPRINRLFGGAILVILAVAVTVSCVSLTLKVVKFFTPTFYYICSILLIYFSLSIKALAVETGKVYKALKNGAIQEARDNLSMIVGRDTGNLDEAGIIRATVETIAESAMDGIVAPLFYAFLGGPVLAWAYKAINTLDSMVGYRNERFIEFGKVSAKLDGLVNFIPAKITCFLIGISSWFYGKDGFKSIRSSLQFLFKGQEYNSMAAEAALAYALKVRLGGTSFYNSMPVSKPFLGDSINQLEYCHIQESVSIMYLCSFLCVLSGSVLFCLLGGR